MQHLGKIPQEVHVVLRNHTPRGGAERWQAGISIIYRAKCARNLEGDWLRGISANVAVDWPRLRFK